MHLRSLETVGNVEVVDGGLVGLHQPGAEAPGREEVLGKKAEAAGDRLAAEILIAGDGDPFEVAVLAEPGVVGDHAAALLRLPRFVLHIGVEIAFALEIIAKVAPAFEQQVFVHGAFLENGDELVQLRAGDSCPGEFDVDRRARHDF